MSDTYTVGVRPRLELRVPSGRIRIGPGAQGSITIDVSGNYRVGIDPLSFCNRVGWNEIATAIGIGEPNDLVFIRSDDIGCTVTIDVRCDDSLNHPFRQQRRSSGKRPLAVRIFEPCDLTPIGN